MHRIIDAPRGLRGKALHRNMLHSQRQWIENCENNGQSYAGPNGRAIRQADMNELKRLETLVK